MSCILTQCIHSFPLNCDNKKNCVREKKNLNKIDQIVLTILLIKRVRDLLPPRSAIYKIHRTSKSITQSIIVYFSIHLFVHYMIKKKK